MRKILLIIINFGEPENLYFQIKSNRPDRDGNIDNEIVNDDVKIAEILNRFFSNAVKDLKISGVHGAVP